MSWKQFEQFVQWEQRWQGDSRRVFSILDPDSTGYIYKSYLLEMKRTWNTQKDIGIQSASAHVENFKWSFSNRWGTLGRGWRLALDTGSTGHCPQQTFMRCCHAIGMNKGLKTLWRKLTKGDPSRSICLRDLDPELDKIFKDFALKLVTLHSTLRQGWCAICRAGGGHLNEEGFEQSCTGMGMDAKGSKLLFTALDPTKRRYLSEYDKLDFLEIWNPGNQGGIAAAAAAAAAAMTETTKQANAVEQKPQMGGQEEVPSIPNLGHFEFELVMSKEEYSEYLRRARGTRIRQGLQGKKIDVGAETRRKPPIGGNKPRPPSAPASTRSGSGKVSSDPKLANENLWHDLAPNTLGSGKASLQSSARLQPAGPSLSRLLSCPTAAG